MSKQATVYICALLLLETSYSFAEQNHFVPELCTSDARDVDNADIRYRNSNQCYKYAESFNLINLPLLPIMFARSKYLPNGQCKKDARRFINELQNGTLWAMQMFDSSTKYPDGVLYGNTRHLGNFDECYNLQVHVEKKGIDINKINGKYCLVDLKYGRRDKSEMTHSSPIIDFDPNESFWEAVEERGNFIRVPRYFVQLAMCVPSSCSAKEIEIALKKPLEEINVNNSIEIHIAVQKKLCQTVEEGPQFTFAAKLYCVVLLGLLILIIIGTYYDVKLSNFKGKITNFQDVILCFSLPRNFKSICQINPSHPGIDSIHFIRFCMTCLISYGHRTFRYYTNPTINFIDLEKYIVSPTSAFYVNGTIMPDICYAIGATLISYQLLEYLHRRKKLNFIGNIISRYLRLTPSYIVVIFFHAWILPHFGSGPFWRQQVEQEAMQCAANWWTNLLYVNNYVNSTENCMFQSWYLSADFQLFILGQMVIYIFWRMSRKTGYLFLGILTIVSCSISFFAIYSYGVRPTIHIIPLLISVRDSPDYSPHTKTHLHAVGYIVGIIAGAIIHDHQRAKWQLPKIWSHILVLPLPITLITMSQLWSYRYSMPFNDASILETASYAFFQRLIPSSCICIVIVTLSVSQLKFYHNFITMLNWIQPLARLSYGVFLVGDIFHLYDHGRTRSARMYSSYDMLWDTIPDTVFSYTISLLLTLSVEEPSRRLWKRIFRKNDKNANEKYVQ